MSGEDHAGFSPQSGAGGPWTETHRFGIWEHRFGI